MMISSHDFEFCSSEKDAVHSTLCSCLLCEGVCVCVFSVRTPVAVSPAATLSVGCDSPNLLPLFQLAVIHLRRHMRPVFQQVSGITIG